MNSRHSLSPEEEAAGWQSFFDDPYEPVTGQAPPDPKNKPSSAETAQIHPSRSSSVKTAPERPQPSPRKSRQKEKPQLAPKPSRESETGKQNTKVVSAQAPAEPYYSQPVKENKTGADQEPVYNEPDVQEQGSYGPPPVQESSPTVPDKSWGEAEYANVSTHALPPAEDSYQTTDTTDRAELKQQVKTDKTVPSSSAPPPQKPIDKFIGAIFQSNIRGENDTPDYSHKSSTQRPSSNGSAIHTDSSQLSTQKFESLTIDPSKETKSRLYTKKNEPVRSEPETEPVKMAAPSFGEVVVDPASVFISRAAFTRGDHNEVDMAFNESVILIEKERDGWSYVKTGLGDGYVPTHYLRHPANQKEEAECVAKLKDSLKKGARISKKLEQKIKEATIRFKEEPTRSVRDLASLFNRN